MPEHESGTVMFELMEQHRQPALGQGMAHLLGLLSDLPQIAGRVREIQDTYRILPMSIDKALQPVCAIWHRTDGFGPLQATPRDLHGGQIGKGGCRTEARKVGMGGGP